MVLITDTSRTKRMGYALMQMDTKQRLWIVTSGSCTHTPTQERYTTVELEALAMAWAMKKCDYFLRGRRTFKILTDHRPLVGIFQKGVSELDNARLQQSRERTIPYLFVIRQIPGKENIVADALSRLPLFDHCGIENEIAATPVTV